VLAETARRSKDLNPVVAAVRPEDHYGAIRFALKTFGIATLLCLGVTSTSLIVFCKAYDIHSIAEFSNWARSRVRMAFPELTRRLERIKQEDQDRDVSAELGDET